MTPLEQLIQAMQVQQSGVPVAPSVPAGSFGDISMEPPVADPFAAPIDLLAEGVTQPRGNNPLIEYQQEIRDAGLGDILDDLIGQSPSDMFGLPNLTLGEYGDD